jgi:hypothetical protein
MLASHNVIESNSHRKGQMWLSSEYITTIYILLNLYFKKHLFTNTFRSFEDGCAGISLYYV